MIGLGQDSKPGQLVSHSFTVFPGPTVHDPTALLTNITYRYYSCSRGKISAHIGLSQIDWYQPTRQVISCYIKMYIEAGTNTDI